MITEKSIIYNQCLKLANHEHRETYKKLYKKTTLNFWKCEYRNFVRKYIHKRQILKVMTQSLPIEIYFKISSYLYLNNLKE